MLLNIVFECAFAIFFIEMLGKLRGLTLTPASLRCFFGPLGYNEPLVPRTSCGIFSDLLSVTCRAVSAYSANVLGGQACSPLALLSVSVPRRQ